jgi:hypothetical protein
MGDTIDQVITIPMRVGSETVVIERQRHLYEEARRRQGGLALTMQAAERLVGGVKDGDFVLLLTGLGDTPWWPAGEMDGPPGVASIARALAYGLGARPVYLAEPGMVPPIIAASRTAGVPVYEAEVVAEFGLWRSAALVTMPLGVARARERALALLDQLRPAAVVACEKLGPNAHGEYGAVDGQIPAELIDHVSTEVFLEARRRGLPTVGIGDVGNELGLGVVEDVTNGYRGPTPYRKGGAGTVTAADVGIVATVSNWGGYGLAAALAFLLKNLDCLQDERMEARILAASAAAGAVDFQAGVPIDQADGKSLEVHQAMITLLRTVVGNRIRPLAEGASTDGSRHRFLPAKFTEAAYRWRDWRARTDNGAQDA